jgi:predicted glycoside hydrolase/deacetylase ChbG (UPF0249 family)
MRVVINADDFGLSDGVCKGILQAMHCGRVSSTSAMLCVPGSVELLTRAVDDLAGRVGVHLQLTNGTPCLPPEAVPTLVDADGEFPRQKIGNVSTIEVAREWRAQIDRLRDLSLHPTHLDTHHHVHRDPALLAVVADLARELGVAVRPLSAAMTAQLRAHGVRCADACQYSWFGGDLSPRSLASALAAHAGRGAIVELMCHPGMVDENLRARSTYATERERELATLCSDELAPLFESLDIAIVPMSAVQ